MEFQKVMLVQKAPQSVMNCLLLRFVTRMAYKVVYIIILHNWWVSYALLNFQHALLIVV